MPYFFDIHIPEEDSLGLPPAIAEGNDAVDVAVMRLPHIANFDDFDPLRYEAGVRIRYVGRLGEFGEPDLMIIPGSKTTMADLDWLREQGLAERIVRARRNGTPVIGICAGYQMLGTSLSDPDGVESDRREAPGLSLLPTSTAFLRDKATHQAAGHVVEGRGLLGDCQGAEFTAYEIHMGTTTAEALSNAFAVRTRSGRSVDLPEGVLDNEGLTLGTYLHGLFHNQSVRRTILECATTRRGSTLPAAGDGIDQNAEYDKLASLVRQSLDMELLNRVTGFGK